FVGAILLPRHDPSAEFPYPRREEHGGGHDQRAKIRIRLDERWLVLVVVTECSRMDGRIEPAGQGWGLDAREQGPHFGVLVRNGASDLLTALHHEPSESYTCGASYGTSLRRAGRVPQAIRMNSPDTCVLRAEDSTSRVWGSAVNLAWPSNNSTP